MTDVLTRKQRSFNMSRIKGKGTKPEIKIKDFLKSRKFIYQPKTYGNPDFINFDNRIVIFIDGCFWHKCPKHFIRPASNILFWKNKINENARRDMEIKKNYLNSEWKVIRVWEHEIKSGRFINLRIFRKL